MSGLARANLLHSACIGGNGGRMNEAAARADIEAQIAALRARSPAPA